MYQPPSHHSSMLDRKTWEASSSHQVSSTQRPFKYVFLNISKFWAHNIFLKVGLFSSRIVLWTVVFDIKNFCACTIFLAGNPSELLLIFLLYKDDKLELSSFRLQKAELKYLPLRRRDAWLIPHWSFQVCPLLWCIAHHILRIDQTCDEKYEIGIVKYQKYIYHLGWS